MVLENYRADRISFDLGRFPRILSRRGRYLPSAGTFDHDAAERSFDEVKDGINGLPDHLGTVAQMMVATVESDQQTAQMSLRVTYGGLVLIVVGFALQTASYLM